MVTTCTITLVTPLRRFAASVTTLRYMHHRKAVALNWICVARTLLSAQEADPPQARGQDCPRPTGGNSSIPMQIRILFFGILKDLVGRSTDMVDLPEGTRVKDVLSHYARQAPRLEAMLPSLACSVNEEYASADRKLAAGDE